VCENIPENKIFFFSSANLIVLIVLVALTTPTVLTVLTALTTLTTLTARNNPSRPTCWLMLVKIGDFAGEFWGALIENKKKFEES